MSQKFKNILTERFHDYFYQKLKSKELESVKFFNDFEIGENSRYSFFSAMRSGHRGVTPEQVQLAWEKYGVRPDYLFGIVNQAESMAAEPPPVYAKSVKKDLAKIRELLEQLEKKIENK